MGTPTDLESLRKKIDEVDKKLLELLNERGGIVLEISKLKQENSYNVYDAGREREIEKKLRETNPGPLPSDSVISVFSQIISACRHLQNPIKVAYLGPEGSFSHQAAFNEFGSSTEFMPVVSFEDVFDEVEKERATFGIVPVENSTEGSIGNVLDMFLKSELRVTAEFLQKISHFLLSKTGNIDDIEIVASIPPALGQCKKWISKNLKQADIRETTSTARAAQIASGDKKIAAVAGEIAASVYNLQIVEKHIEDNPYNTTRFWVIGKGTSRITGNDKTSIVFSLKHEPGALQRALSPFSELGINLTKIESRPSKERPWEYVFFVDFEGHSGEDKIKNVLTAVTKNCTFLKVLGSYPKGKGS